jgi:hypothetical protein
MHYSSLARADTSPSAALHSEKVALSFGYSAGELAQIPEGANLGVSCGNPLVSAGLREVGTGFSLIINYIYIYEDVMIGGWS